MASLTPLQALGNLLQALLHPVQAVVHPLPVLPYVFRVIPSVLTSTRPSLARSFLAAALTPFPSAAATVGSETGETAR